MLHFHRFLTLRQTFQSHHQNNRHDIDIATPLRELLDKTGKENAALIMSKEIALGKYQSSDASLEDRLDHAVRVGLAIVTEGCLLYTSPSPRDKRQSRMPSSA